MTPSSWFTRVLPKSRMSLLSVQISKDMMFGQLKATNLVPGTSPLAPVLCKLNSVDNSAQEPRERFWEQGWKVTQIHNFLQLCLFQFSQFWAKFYSK